MFMGNTLDQKEVGREKFRLTATIANFPFRLLVRGPCQLKQTCLIKPSRKIASVSFQMALVL